MHCPDRCIKAAQLCLRSGWFAADPPRLDWVEVYGRPHSDEWQFICSRNSSKSRIGTLLYENQTFVEAKLPPPLSLHTGRGDDRRGDHRNCFCFSLRGGRILFRQNESRAREPASYSGHPATDGGNSTFRMGSTDGHLEKSAKLHRVVPSKRSWDRRHVLRPSYCR